METPVQVTFRDVSPQEAIERMCRHEAGKLERYHGRITSCHVLIALPHHHRHKGNLYRVRVDVVVPGAEFVVDRTPTAHQSDEKLELAIRAAFDAMRRRLEDEVRRQRGDTKTHATPAHGRIQQLDTQRGSGTLATADGRELDFWAASVLDAQFQDLQPGQEVAYHEQQDTRATSVRPVGRHGHRLP